MLGSKLSLDFIYKLNTGAKPITEHLISLCFEVDQTIAEVDLKASNGKASKLK